MQKGFNQVYQFKILLKYSKPPIWRRIQVPETYTFWDLHVAIQDAMGWHDSTIHTFKIFDPYYKENREIGIPDKEFEKYLKIIPGWREKIVNWFKMDNNKAEYIYDYSDYWEHNIVLEKILPIEKGIKYPVCISGKRACPPEKCGGIWYYKELLDILKDKNHEEYEEIVTWFGNEFDPERFDPKEVVFTDPIERLKGFKKDLNS